ncbi:MAG: class I SAM-dependent RNA methyltransferase [Chloroflexota bacterium]|nr:class I SAM-dependent RNA methyltransferase [Chloroflexota bacterium]
METIDLITEQMTYGGAALARHEGRVIFVPFALPGERVRVRIKSQKKRWAEAELVAVLEASPDRIEPRCPHFGPHQCGGCQWQHASYEAQLRYKTAIVREQLQRIGKIEDPPVQLCLGMTEPWYYRNNVQLRSTGEGPGFVRVDNKGVYPIDVCFIMNGAIYPLFQAVAGKPMPGVKRLILRGSERTGERLVVVEGKSEEALPFPADVTVVQGKQPPNRASPKATIHERVGEQTWQITVNSFFQVNTAQAETLLKVVRTLVGALQGGETLLDAYAGVGLFGLSLANEVRHTYLVESYPPAVEDARHHVAGREDVTIIQDTAEDVLPRWEQYGPRPDLVLLDPPRAGCEDEVLRALGFLEVPTIIYVSCDPATQARDLRILLDLGYALDIVQPVDMFPQTYHIESVARLHKQ